MFDKETLIREAKRTLYSGNDEEQPAARLFLLREGLLSARDVWDTIASVFGYKPVQGRSADVKLLIAKLLQSEAHSSNAGQVGAWVHRSNELYQVREANSLTVRVSPMLAYFNDGAWRELETETPSGSPSHRGLDVSDREMLWSDFIDRFNLVNPDDPLTQPIILPRTFSAMLRRNEEEARRASNSAGNTALRAAPHVGPVTDQHVTNKPI